MYRAKSRGGNCYEVFARGPVDFYSPAKAWTPDAILPDARKTVVPERPVP
jgi:hypothetical protein